MQVWLNCWKWKWNLKWNEQKIMDEIIYFYKNKLLKIIELKEKGNFNWIKYGSYFKVNKTIN